jgi:hypothetical protein
VAARWLCRRRSHGPEIQGSLGATSCCETACEVRTNIDRGADFRHYKTFGFFSPLGLTAGGDQR